MSLYVLAEEGEQGLGLVVRKATDAEIIAAALANGEWVEWCEKHRLPKGDGIEDVCVIGYMPLFDPDEDLPCRIVSKLLVDPPTEED